MIVRAFRSVAPLALVVLATAASCKRSDGEVGGQAAALTGTPNLTQFVVYGERSVKLGRDAHANGGDVGVRARAAAAFGAQLRLAQQALVDTSRTVYAPSVSLDQRAVVGPVAADSVVNSGGTRGALTTFPAAVMPPGPLAGGGTPGTTNVTVAANTNRTLDPGTYGTLTNNGVVFLKPGAYSFASITLADSAHLVANGPGATKVNVAGQFVAGTRITLAALSGGAGALSILAAGNDATKTAISIGTYASITALLAAPHGTLTLGDHTDARGAFSAFDVVTGEAVVLTYQTGFPPPPANPPQQLGGYVTAEIAAGPLLRPVPQSTLINFAIGLDLADRAGLVAKVRAVSDPKSPSYRQYVTPAAFAATYSPTAAQYQQLQTWATAAGLTVTKTFANRLLLDVRGTAGQVGQALSSGLVYRARPDGTEFYSLDREPAVTLAPSAPIYRISGLDNRVIAKPGAKVGTVAPGVGSGIGGRFISRDFRQSYADCTTNSGAGEQVGLFELDGFKAADISGFGCPSGLQTCNAAGTVISGTLPTVSTVLIDGYGGGTISTNGQFEVTIDIQMAMEMAPGLSQVVVYEANNDGNVSHHNNILNSMAADPSVRQFSSSWFFNVDSNTQTILYTMAAQGQSFMQCSGDQGSSSWSTDPGDIRDLDAVTVVGGTILNMNFGPPLSYVSETTWNRAGESAGGGGVASNTSVPDYQTTFAAAVGQAGKRVLPDVSLVATDEQGFFNGMNSGGAGTSLAAPLFAAWIALANEQSAGQGLSAAGFVNPFLYDVAGAAQSIYAASFHDIADASHNAGNCPAGTSSGFCAMGWTVSTTSTNYSAGAGYDMATGLGSPTCYLLDEVGTSSIKTPQPDAGAPEAGVDGGAEAGAEGGAPETPSLFLVATEGSKGVEFCMQGGGFDPGHQVQFKYLDLPNGAASQDSSQAPLLVTSDGRYTNLDPTWGGGPASVHGFVQFCDAMDVAGNMTVRVIQVDDPSKVATASISNAWICGAKPRQSFTNETPLPFPPMFGQTTCPLPPD